MKITYHGHSCFELEDGPHRLVIDPFLSGNETADIAPSDLKVQYILLTHGHFDHVGDTAEIAKQNDAVVIAPFELATYLEWQGLKTHPLQMGGGFDFPFGRVKLTHAFHGSGLMFPERQQILYLGNPAGMILQMGGKTIYHAGDTGLFGDMKTVIGERHSIDLAMLPIGDNFTMGPDDALQAAEWIGAKMVLPMHFNTFPVIRQDAAQFVAALQSKGIEGRAMRPGDRLEL